MTSSSPAAPGILLLMHAPLAESMLAVIAHVLGRTPDNALALSLQEGENAESFAKKVGRAVRELDLGGGVLIFTDICGATPYQVGKRFVDEGRVTLIGGASVPMLARAFTYRKEGLAAAVSKAVSGATEGIGVLDRIEEEKDSGHATA
jgi:PTS system ascorbate-specific IIA component